MNGFNFVGLAFVGGAAFVGLALVGSAVGGVAKALAEIHATLRRIEERMSTEK